MGRGGVLGPRAKRQNIGIMRSDEQDIGAMFAGQAAAQQDAVAAQLARMVSMELVEGLLAAEEIFGVRGFYNIR